VRPALRVIFVWLVTAEELVGSHGGMGWTQSFPFLLHPSDLKVPAEELVGAESVHRQLRRWLVQLGHDEYSDVV